MIELLIINSLWCVGLHAVTRWYYVPDMSNCRDIESKPFGKLLYKLSYWTRDWPDVVRDPLTECLTCMASIHSIPFYFIYGAENWPIEYAILWPVYAIILAGLNTLLGGWTKF